MKQFATIAGIGVYVPDRVLTNLDLETMVDTTDEWITTRTGIKERRIASPDQASSDLGAVAARRALDHAGIPVEQVDLLIVGTSSPDNIFPSTACRMQALLGLSCPAYDVLAACTSFVYALQSAVAAIESGRARTVLVVGAEALSRFVDFTDRSTCVLFGDGAGAVVVTASEEPGVLGIVLGADGSGADVLTIPAGGSARPCTAETLEAREHYIRMNGSEVFRFAVRIVPDATRQALEASDLTIQDLDWLVPHQANQRIIGTVADRLGLPSDRIVSNIHGLGNTSSASIPLALYDLYTSGRLARGDMVALVGFGAGLTWGAAVLRWPLEPLKEA